MSAQLAHCSAHNGLFHLVSSSLSTVFAKWRRRLRLTHTHTHTHTHTQPHSPAPKTRLRLIIHKCIRMRVCVCLMKHKMWLYNHHLPAPHPRTHKLWATTTNTTSTREKVTVKIAFLISSTGTRQQGQLCLSHFYLLCVHTVGCIGKGSKCKFGCAELFYWFSNRLVCVRDCSLCSSLGCTVVSRARLTVVATQNVEHRAYVLRVWRRWQFQARCFTRRKG